MRPILLQGPEHAITQIKYNRDGDLLFTVAKDPVVNVWYSVNGERLGTYNGHTGAVWCMDVDWDMRHVLFGSADNSCRLFDCETGKQLALLETNSAVRTCGFEFGGHENGELNQYSAKSGEIVNTIKEHSKQINDIQSSRNMTMFITASKDCTAKLFDTTTLEHQKSFRTEIPVNSAALSPIYDQVVLGGGQEAMDVTTTSTRIGKFEARFFHI
ncbi:eukaryotic translation initiation factor 3 subunit I [Pelobates cultripes]|uniref:Serine-threonine kinase receptor-associated protein n=1 Tax=Pelobates cultripes TaxID=61616 RepID=A0AAD1R308_PELCU|nr:eukaryotic translation initiation factor 3 subunit I [Pelobates cultripes]